VFTPHRDLLYYAENGLFEAAFRVAGALIETGIIEAESKERRFNIPQERARYTGLLPICEDDLTIIFRRGCAQIQRFRAETHRFQVVHQPEGGIEVRMEDLVVTRVQCDRFERAHGLGTPNRSVSPANAGGFVQTNDHADVTMDGVD